jgi:hypothetical protein
MSECVVCKGAYVCLQCCSKASSRKYACVCGPSVVVHRADTLVAVVVASPEQVHLVAVQEPLKLRTPAQAHIEVTLVHLGVVPMRSAAVKHVSSLGVCFVLE